MYSYTHKDAQVETSNFESPWKPRLRSKSKITDKYMDGKMEIHNALDNMYEILQNYDLSAYETLNFFILV